jgi:hypothetical protein
MVTFRNNNNNNRRPPFRNTNNRRPPFRNNNEGSKFSNNDNFRRSNPSRNNHNASKLIEKYNEMAREALANEDRVLSENYFQHADHFTRVQNEQEINRMARINSSPSKAEAEVVKPIETEVVTPAKSEELKEVKVEQDAKKSSKIIEKKNEEKKVAIS